MLCTSLSLNFLSLFPYIRTFLICSIYSLRTFTRVSLYRGLAPGEYTVDDTVMSIYLAWPLRAVFEFKYNELYSLHLVLLRVPKEK